MSVTVHIPSPLRRFTQHEAEVAAEAATVGEALEQVTSRHGELSPHIYGDDGAVRSFVNLYVNDTDVRSLDGLATPIGSGDEVRIVPSIAGGTGTDGYDNRFGPLIEGARELTDEEVKRYSRHLIMPQVGLKGQQKLKDSRVLLVGTGGLGAPLGQYLAAAGVGTLGLVDFDVVEFSNLQRQVLFDTDDVGRRKVAAAKERIQGLNPNVDVQVHETRLTSDNALDIVDQYDLVIDGTDNFPTRYLVNDACVLLDKPNVYGSIFRFEGQASVFWAEHGPCYRCLYREPPPPGLVPSCAEGGVLGILPGIVGNIQAMEAVKVLLGKGEPLIGRLLLFDAMQMEFRELKLERNPECPMCGEDPEITELIDYEEFCGIPGQDQHEQVAEEDEVTVEYLAQRLEKDGDDVFILDVRNPSEYEICNLGGHLIPVRELTERVHEVPQDKDVVVHCKSGGRSAQAVNLLKELGYERVWNLKGGINEWAEKVDEEMPTY